MNRVRPYLAPLGIYFGTRLLAAVFVLLAASGRVVHLEDLPGYHAHSPAALPPSYAAVMTSWDAQWYWDIATVGYASSPLGPDGLPAQTTLAFFPLFPLLAKAVMTLTHLGFGVVAPTLSLGFGAAAVLVVHRLVRERTDARRALACVALLCCFVAAPILQAAYTESLALLLVAGFLLLLSHRRYWWALLPLLLLAFTRNLALALLPVVITHWAVRVHRARQGTGPTGVPHPTLAVLTIATIIATAAWPVVAGLVGGRPDAYLTTLKSWPGFTGSAFRPPWAAALGDAGPGAWIAAGALGLVLVAMMLSRPVRQWGPELWAWTGSSIGFVLLTTSATTSLFRYLLLAFPLGLVLTPSTPQPSVRRAQNAVVVAICVLGLAAQWLWIDKLLVFAGPDGGWGYP